MEKTVILDYGMGNLGSVHKAFLKVGFKAVVSDKKTDIRNCDVLVVPGVGAFGDAVKNLKKKDLFDEVIEHINKDKPYLGICLGLQLLMEKSYEGGEKKGLGLIKGNVVRFTQGVKVPHIGWNEVEIVGKQKLFNGIRNRTMFYFVHSYYIDPEDKSVIAGRTDYGVKFCCALNSKNIYGVQFHPEKSQDVGLKFLSNFRKIIQCS